MKDDLLNRIGAVVVIWVAILFGWEIVAPYFFAPAGDANTKAVLANVFIAIVSFLFGTNVGRQKQEETLHQMAKAAADKQPTPDVVVSAGDSVTVQAEDPE